MGNRRQGLRVSILLFSSQQSCTYFYFGIRGLITLLGTLVNVLTRILLFQVRRSSRQGSLFSTRSKIFLCFNSTQSTNVALVVVLNVVVNCVVRGRVKSVNFFTCLEKVLNRSTVHSSVVIIVWYKGCVNTLNLVGIVNLNMWWRVSYFIYSHISSPIKDLSILNINYFLINRVFSIYFLN